MNKYIAIGHFKGSKESTISVVDLASTKANFAENLRGNEFVAIAILTEKAFNEIKNMDAMEMYDKVKKLTTNWRVWNLICEYIEQCSDIVEEKIANAKW